MPEIFMSYRRADSVGTAGRLFDRLAERFGADQVFRDVDSIDAGENFDETIRDGLRLATVVLIVIGPRWLDVRTKDGTRRIDDPADYVRREIEAALSSDAVVIPLLVEGAALPAAESLPASIRALVLRNTRELSDRRWDADTRDLLRHLEERFGIPPRESTTTLLPRERARRAQSPAQAALAAFAGFVPNLFALLTQPRRFLARYTAGRAPDLLAAVIFLLLALLLADLVLTAVYTPRDSLLGFYISGVVIAVMASAAISAPLWLAWRLMGAARHYARLIVVLLHQVAIVHVAGFVTGTIVFMGIELRSIDSVNRTMEEARKQPSVAAALEIVNERVPPLFAGPEVLLASGLAILATFAGVVWLIRSWGAYRDAFGLSRRRSAGAFLLFVFACWAISALSTWLVAAADRSP